MTSTYERTAPIMSTVTEIRVAAYVYLAATTFLAWDICITMDQEVDLVWSQPWSLVKLLYFFVRYVPMLFQYSTIVQGPSAVPGLDFSPYECFVWQVYTMATTMTIFMAVEYILLLRINALYNQSRPIQLAVRILYFIEIISMVVGIWLSAPGYKFDSICEVVESPSTVLIFGVAEPIFQTILFMLTTFKFVQVIKGGYGRIPIVDLLMRDGIWAFIVIEVLLCGNGVMYFAMDRPYNGVLVPWLLSAYSFIGYRVILNLRRMYPPSHDSLGNFTSAVCFAERNPPIQEHGVTITN